MAVYGYGRASTDKQDLTEEVQLASVQKRHAAEYPSLPWGGWFYDAAVSGSKHFTERPEGLRLWIMLQPGDVVLVHHSDRAFRNTADALKTMAMMRARGVLFLMPDVPADSTTADGEFIATIQFAIGTRERRRIGERTSAALRAKAARGERLGGKLQVPPFGWRFSGTGLTEDRDERHRIEQMARWRDAEGLSFDRLEQRVGYPPYCWRREVRVKGAGVWSRRNIRLALEARRLGYPRVYMGGRRGTGAETRTLPVSST